MSSRRFIIIAAGGTGSRLNANLPKQYMLLQDKPVLMHTIEAFEGIVDEIIVALHPNMFSLWQDLCNQYNFKIDHRIVFGGKTRFQSVQNALNELKNNIVSLDDLHNATIGIHDAARPLIDQHLIEQSFKTAEEGKCNTLGVKSTNSIRVGNQENSNSIDRNIVWQIQTPQTFPADVLYKAYNQEEDELFTDDCSVVERLGYTIHIIESSNKNIKLTFAEDFQIANIYLSPMES